jgi:hypothetical protein
VVDVAHIDRDCSNIAIRDNGKVQAVADDRSHRGGNRSVQWIYSGAQVVEQLFLRPRDGRGIGLGERWCDPVIDHGARVGVSQLFTAERIARRMTAPTIADRLCQIGSAIPLGVFCRIWPVASASEA